jgi:pimeloyl-ACP methyl ester carboxylesterase
MGDLRSAYRFLVPSLVEAGFRVATMDLRGHGDSDDGFADFDDEAAARDALELIAHLGGPAVLVGNSMGAGASVIAAADAPAAVTALVLLGPFVRNPPTSPLAAAALRLALARPWGPLVWRSYYRSLFPGSRPADFAAQEQEMAKAFRRGSHWRSFQRTARTTHAPAEQRISSILVPSLTVMGTADPDWKDASAEGRWVAESLGGELLLVEGAGHYPMTQAPDVVGPAIAAFARKVSAVA